MSFFRNILLNIGRRYRCPFRPVTLRFRTDLRTAQFVTPLIEKLISSNPDGDTYRWVISHWLHAERPPLYQYLGSVSLCRIDGPLQQAPDDYPEGWYVPLGGLIQAPGITAHLTPFEAASVQARIREAIEREIVDWSREYGLHERPPVQAHYDRASADRVAMAQIANWTPGSDQALSPLHNVEECPDHV